MLLLSVSRMKNINGCFAWNSGIDILATTPSPVKQVDTEFYNVELVHEKKFLIKILQ